MTHTERISINRLIESAQVDRTAITARVKARFAVPREVPTPTMVPFEAFRDVCEQRDKLQQNYEGVCWTNRGLWDALDKRDRIIERQDRKFLKLILFSSFGFAGCLLKLTGLF